MNPVRFKTIPLLVTLSNKADQVRCLMWLQRKVDTLSEQIDAPTLLLIADSAIFKEVTTRRIRRKNGTYC